MPLKNKTFERELEFVQLLCNPDYLKWLFDQGYFEVESFKKLLNHLLYWKEDKYKIYLTYPYCLSILEILNGENVLEILKDETFYARISEEQFILWKSNK